MPLALLLAVLAAWADRPAQARVLLRQDEALKIAFGDVTPERRTAYFTSEQLRRAEQSARVKIESRVWTYYVARSSSGEETFAYFDTHIVRTMPETFMAVVDGAGRLRFVELLAFHEPDDYLPSKRWLRQFDGRPLDGELLVRRAIRNITGASLTSQELTSGVRRVLAVHEMLNGLRMGKTP
ncbi:MAG: FMN-binding protein [Elusimicrobia bacterium]|nr:FMN-binding protein [Elusimicrobiota bacterium]